jgi:hypothetical protein
MEIIRTSELFQTLNLITFIEIIECDEKYQIREDSKGDGFWIESSKSTWTRKTNTYHLGRKGELYCNCEGPEDIEMTLIATIAGRDHKIKIKGHGAESVKMVDYQYSLN